MSNRVRARLLALIDSDLCLLMFGAGLPLSIGLLLWWCADVLNDGNVERRVRFKAFGSDTMMLVVAVALAIGVWTVWKPRGRIAPPLFAIVLGFAFELQHESWSEGQIRVGAYRREGAVLSSEVRRINRIFGECSIGHHQDD